MPKIACMDPVAPTLSIEHAATDALLLRLSGTWRSREHPPSHTEVGELLGAEGLRQVGFDSTGVESWDTGLLAFVVGVGRGCEEHGLALDSAGLPSGVAELLELAREVPEKTGTGRGGARDPLLERIGKNTLKGWDASVGAISFLGEAMLSLGRFVVGRAQYRRSDLTLFLQDCGSSALGIVALISFMVGLILSFVGAQQLALFGATSYTANLVGLAMAREMAPIMVAIIMAGRTGAAFAAQLGTMTVNEEVDALATFGISPMDFLVLPRMLALIVMMPLLCLYADLMGMLGGAVVGAGVYGIPLEEYWQQTKSSLPLIQIWIGVAKSVVFGVLVALSGCLKGIRSGRSASAVGDAATSAVVTSIVLIIVTDAIFAVVLDVLGL